MSELVRIGWPLGFAAVAIVTYYLFQLWARGRSRGRDSAVYWTRVVAWSGLLLGLAGLISAAFELWPRAWDSGYHAYLDLVANRGAAPSYLIALAVPFGVWLLVLAVGLRRAEGDRESARWLAGGIGYSPSRVWVLVFALPLMAILGLALPRLGTGPGGFPGFTWSTLAVLALSLFGVALSSGTEPARTGRRRPLAAAESALPAWPASLEERGVDLERLASWPATTNGRDEADDTSGELAERLRVLAVSGVAPELVEAVERTIRPFVLREEAGGPITLLYAPADCGQVEAVGAAAALLAERFHQSTLVVTPSGAAELTARLARWSTPEQRPVKVGSRGELDLLAPIWVVDAQALSDRLLADLKGRPRTIHRIGLVVWWELDAYTGVRAANLWAISRRLHRLIRAHGRSDVRTLALLRRTPYPHAQIGKFVRTLLPHDFDKEAEVFVDRRFPRTVELYRLQGHRRLFADAAAQAIAERSRHPGLIAAKVSVEAGWPTHLALSEEVTDSDSGEILQGLQRREAGRSGLRTERIEAGASIAHLTADRVLSLTDDLSQGGRACPESAVHHVGITVDPNPYLAFLVASLAAGEAAAGLRSSRRLICAEAQPGVIRNHLLLALSELPATHHDLLKDFRWDVQEIRSTLETLADRQELQREEVRYLWNRDLEIQYLYQSRQPPQLSRRPLGSVGSDLVEVRDPDAGQDPSEGVRLLVDRERLVIEAYPHRVFYWGGNRFRVAEWQSREVAERGFVACHREDELARTWRWHEPSILELSGRPSWARLGQSGSPILRSAIPVVYEERVEGALRVVVDLSAGTETPQLLELDRELGSEFSTSALVLAFQDAAEPVALLSLCQALREVLPVHLGVEADTLELVPLPKDSVRGMDRDGLALVDLHPGGVGLVDALQGDDAFLLQVLAWTREWLERCACDSDPGCPACLQTPSALTVSTALRPQRAAALDLLARVLG